MADHLKEITIKDRQYRIGKLNPFQQLHISRFLTPILLGLAKAADDAPKVNDSVPQGAEVMDPEVALAQAKAMALGVLKKLVWSDALQPAAKAIASMPEEHVNYIIFTCLSVVGRQVEGTTSYQRVMPVQGRLQFDDIEMPQMMQLSFEVIMSNMAGFFDSALFA